MKILASSAFPGPPIVTSTNSPDSSTMIVNTTQVTALPALNNFVSSTTPSTSRPDKLNMTPPQNEINMAVGNYSDESDNEFDSGNNSRSGASRNDGRTEQKKRERVVLLLLLQLFLFSVILKKNDFSFLVVLNIHKIL
uniref:Uncharacterized protein n=1 Tax=Caenorhabditis tropicalis TaxID=1561998 RepID=A0A1I7UB12_9PELO